MAYVSRLLKDTDFETVVHVTITGTNGTELGPKWDQLLSKKGPNQTIKVQESYPV